MISTLTRWGATTQSPIIDMLHIKSDKPSSQRDVLIRILVEDMPNKLYKSEPHRYQRIETNYVQDML